MMSKKIHKIKKSGRSIEEILVRRKIDASDPSSWPDPSKDRDLLSRSSSLPRIQHDHSDQTEDPEYLVRNTASKSTPNLQISTNDSENVIEQLVDYCKTLQYRIKELEVTQGRTLSRLKTNRSGKGVENHIVDGDVSHNELVHSHHPGTFEQAHEKSVKWRTHVASAPTPNPDTSKIKQSSEINPTIKDSISRLDIKVLQLKELFKQADPIEDRKNAATKIGACIRGFIARAHFNRYQKAIKEWKWSRCRRIVWLLDMLLGNQSKLDAGIQQLALNRSVRWARSVFSKWNQVTRQSAPLRRAIRHQAHLKGAAIDRQLLMKVFAGLKSASIGHLSLKKSKKARMELMQSIRSELSEKYMEKGKLGVVPEEEVIHVMHRRVLLNFLEAKRMLHMRSVFGGFCTLLKLREKYEVNARVHWFKTRVGKCFYAWSDYIYMVSVGLERKRWPGPRKYEIRYNQKRIDIFARQRQLLFVLKPWIQYFRLQSIVKARWQNYMALFVKRNFTALAKVTHERRKLRVLTVNNWRGYARLMIEKPFFAWLGYFRAAKNHFNEQLRIVNAYIRWKRRQWLIRILKTWRHQALYGRTDGLYTRKMLLSSLGEQKQMSTALEKMLALQTVEMEECQNLVEVEIGKRRDLEARLTATLLELNRQRILVHHTEQEMRRLEMIIKAMTKINPSQISHLMKLQPDFKFKERLIAANPNDDVFASKITLDVAAEEPDGDPGKSNLSASQPPASAPPAPVASAPPAPAPVGSSTSRPDAEEYKKDSSTTSHSQAVDSVVGHVRSSASTTNGDQNATLEGEKDEEEVRTPGTETGTGTGLGMQSSSQSAKNATATPGSSVAHVAHNSSVALGVDRAPHQGLRGVSETTITQQPVFPSQDPLSLLPPEDRLLLERAKWLVARFAKAPPDEFIAKEIDIVDDSIDQATLDALVAKEAAKRARAGADGSDISDSEESEEGEDDDGDSDDMSDSSESRLAKAKAKEAKKVPKKPTKEIIYIRPPILPGADMASIVAPAVVDAPVSALEHLHQLEAYGENVENAISSDMAPRMIIGLMDFLIEGSVTSFHEEDRRDWIKSVLQSSSLPQPSTSADAVKFQVAVDDAAEEIMVQHSWRKALLNLRVLHPGAGNYSGVGHELDPSDPVTPGLFARLIDMRDDMTGVMRTQMVKFARGGEISGADAAHALVAGPAGVDPINVYAGNLTQQLTMRVRSTQDSVRPVMTDG